MFEIRKIDKGLKFDKLRSIFVAEFAVFFIKHHEFLYFVCRVATRNIHDFNGILSSVNFMIL